VYITGFRRENLRLLARRRDKKSDRLEQVVQIASGVGGSGIVYCATRREVEDVDAALSAAGLQSAAYHAGLPDETRTQVQDEFQTGRVPIIVATNAFGMGVDKSDVRLVLHYQLPGTLESYYQEAGRAGRDGEPADCVSLWGKRDQHLYKTFIDRSRPPPRELRRVAQTLRRVIGAGKRGTVDWAYLAKVTRRTREELEPLLSSLQRLGAIRIYSASVSDGSDPALLGRTNGRFSDGEGENSGPLDVGVRSSGPDWSAVAQLRSAALDGLRAVHDYAVTRRCRRAVLLRYFGDEPDGCRGCDVCAPG
jgi:ATP-dependent DNA helicase RecQ